MPFHKKVLYYGLMLFLTLIAIEGMARVAYYAAYGQWYGRGGLPIETIYPPLHQLTTAQTPRPANSGRLHHPFYGYTEHSYRERGLNAMPPRLWREDTVIIGLLGGSVAEDVHPSLERALRRWFAAHRRPREAAVVKLAFTGQKQPQQTIIIANTLLLGGEFDLIVNLDGLNEIALSARQSRHGRFPFFPDRWVNLVRQTGAELPLWGQGRVLRREQARLAAVAATSPLRRSALFGLAHRYRQERTAAAILRLNHELDAAAAGYNLEKHGPRNWSEGAELLPEAARVWYRGSVALARLAEVAGADYYHFLQPSQYVPAAKPLSPTELAFAYKSEGEIGSSAVQGYPLLMRLNQALQSQGISSFDLTGIFADNRETLYIDDCCHFNARGNELLAAAMVQRMAPALRRLGGASPQRPVSALAAARRPAAPDVLLIDGAFQVYLQGDGKWLRYVRADCAPADTTARFFLHLTPRDWADLPFHRRGHSFDNRDFSFGEAGSRLWRKQCLAQIRLPDYPIAHLRTGQYAAGAGEVWAGEFAFPE